MIVMIVIIFIIFLRASIFIHLRWNKTSRFVGVFASRCLYYVVDKWCGLLYYVEIFLDVFARILSVLLVDNYFDGLVPTGTGKKFISCSHTEDLLNQID